MTLSIELLIEAMRAQVAAQAPELLPIFDLYANEARFGRALLEENLSALASGAAVLEVGAGMYLLAIQLRREGFAVTALEPIGKGFSLFKRLQQVIEEYAVAQGIMPEVLACPAEELAERRRFAFAYSINVMEHVGDVGQSLARIAAALAPGGYYRFVCPNYSFPYESHFHIPIVWNKALTAKLWRRRIAALPIEDAQDVWDSLNWITVTKVKRLCRALSLRARFDTGILGVFVRRATQDALFSQRHHPWLCRALVFAERTAMLRIISYFPAELLPVMDCVVTESD
ncbi:MAG: methyltransferase domain-containing protein [Pseudomonadota bacterium]|nr:methyltransferase domain-containing protein [Pseudomonadota bacterium]